MLARWALLAAVVPVAPGAAWEYYKDYVPNGHSVLDASGTVCSAFGHQGCRDGASLNRFGMDFKAAGRRWNAALCAQDSWGFGISNAELFGDPNCTWRQGMTPARGFGVSSNGTQMLLSLGVSGEDPQKMRDGGTIAFICCLVLLCAACAAARVLPASMAAKLYLPGPMSWNVANFLGFLTVALALMIFTAALGRHKDSSTVTKVLGLASAIAASLPIWWSLMKVGPHTAVGMSREAAWRMHIAFGDLTLLFGSIHGIYALANPYSVFQVASYTVGFVGWVLMWLGVLGTPLPHLKVITYDWWKLLHGLSMIGYILVFVHMSMEAAKKNTGATIAVAVFNGLALGASVFHGLYTWSTFRRATVLAGQVAIEQAGRHVFLSLKVPGFTCAPGQWAHVRVPSISPVPHPFTVVPGSSPDEVQFFIKVSGQFTARLADAVATQKMPKISLQGPYGSPPVPSPLADATVFVLGGVGVTPALSLLAAARQSSRMPPHARTRVYWAVRSPALVRQCEAVLGPQVDRLVDCIRLDGCTEKSAGELPPWILAGRQDVGEWLSQVGKELKSAGASAVQLFVCGPGPLAEAAKRGARQATSVTWLVHLEEFLFLPKMGGGGSGAGPAPPKGAVHSAPVVVGARQSPA